MFLAGKHHLKTDTEEKKKKATKSVTLSVIWPSVTRFVLCCKAKRDQQQPQRACNTFRVTLTSYFINRRGLTGPQTVQLMGFVPLWGKLSQKRKETLGSCSHHLVTDPRALHSLGDAQEKLP